MAVLARTFRAFFVGISCLSTITIAGCGGGGGGGGGSNTNLEGNLVEQPANSSSKQPMTVPVPMETSFLTQSGNTLRIDVVLDPNSAGEKTYTLANLKDAPSGGTISETLNAEVSTEPRQLQLRYYWVDPQGVAIQVAYTDPVTLNLNNDPNNLADLAAAPLLYTDDDQDGFSNIAELAGGGDYTNPAITPLPMAPREVRIARAENGDVVLEWQPVEGVSSYNVFMAASADVPASSAINNAVDGMTHSLPADQCLANLCRFSHTRNGGGKLNPDNTYYFVVAAVNEVGQSEPSAEISAIPAIAKPAQVSGVTVVEAKNRNVVLQWNPVPGASSYNVYMAEEEFTLADHGTKRGNMLHSVRNDSAMGAIRYSHDSALDNGKTYWFRITAVKSEADRNDEGAASELVMAAVVSGVPGTPGELVLEPGTEAVRAQWTTVPDADGYVVYFSDKNDQPLDLWQQAAVSGGAATSFSIAPLTAGTWFVRVAATNGNGAGEPTAAQTVAVHATPAGVVNFTPRGRVTNLRTNITAQFDKSIDEQSLVVTVVSATGLEAQGNATYNDTNKRVTWRPSSPLGLNTTYHVKVQHQTSGAANPELTEWTFRTRDGTWQATSDSSTGSIDNTAIGEGVAPRAGVDSSGRALIVWNASPEGLQWAKYDGDWQAARTLTTLRASEVPVPGLAVSGPGDAAVVFDAPLQLRTFSAQSQNWRNCTADNDPACATFPLTNINSSTAQSDVALSDNGNIALIVTVDRSAVATIYDATREAWSTPVTLTSNSPGKASIALAADGAFGVAAWKEGDGAIKVQRFSASAGFTQTTAEQLVNAAGIVSAPIVKISRNGKTAVTWRQDKNIVASTLNDGAPGSAWATANIGAGEQSTSPTRSTASPMLGIDASGNAVVTWVKITPQPRDEADFSNEINEVFWSRFDAATSSWSGAASTNVSVDTGFASIANLNFALDGNGNGILIWKYTEELDKIGATRFNAADKSWGRVQLVLDDAAGTVYSQIQEPVLAIGPNGRGVVATHIRDFDDIDKLLGVTFE